jgi:hypothetical protein
VESYLKQAGRNDEATRVSSAALSTFLSFVATQLAELRQNDHSHALVINISDKFGVAIGENVVDWLVGDGRFLQFVVTDLGTSTPIWRSLKEGIEL